eukprot:TRINITY_DN11946_c0_g1_i1.p1 TRINITY_DN11946_c0_g1~~TRINITY_DN11946_c0_g1_i1.p1  ORF type:complete len:607 (+),score=112.22 TRINITY_DN11946_c0_g1_i1:84-1904(+)
MAQMANLDNATIDLNALRDHARKELVAALESLDGKKVFILDPKLSGPLALIAQTSLLKEHGVENLYHLSGDPIQSDLRNVIYLVRPQMKLMKMIADQIRHDTQVKIQRQYSIYFTPRRTIVCEKVLEDEGVFADVVMHEYPLDLIPFDEDILSLEMETAYKDAMVDGDRSSLYYVARALTKLQAVFGVIPNVKGKGKGAVAVFDMMKRMRREQLGALPPYSGPPEIDMLILLDRQVDMVTPMCTQLTYEGLIDEFMNIHNGAVEVDPTVMGAVPSQRKMKVPLNSSDKLFRELRDLNFGIVGQVLRQKAEAIKADYTEVRTTDRQAQSVSDLKEFVKKLNVLPEMTRHTNIAQHLTATYTTKPAFLSRLHMEQTLVEGRSLDVTLEYIEDLIQKQEPLTSVLRLLCLFSLTNNGLLKKNFDHIRRELLHSYGFEHVFTLNNLEKAGLFIKQEGKSNWALIKRNLRLTVDDVDDANPNDIAYTYSGYAPISIRLVQQALKTGWRPIDDTLRLLPGPWFEKKQASIMNPGMPAEGGLDTTPLDHSGVHLADGRRSLILVVFIGGVTFAEISALRFLSAQEGVKTDFIVATTKLITGSSLLQTLIEDPS